MISLDQKPKIRLTPTEQKAYDFLVLHGMNQTQIGEQLGVHRRTVGAYLKKVYRKKRVSSMWELIVQHYKAEPIVEDKLPSNFRNEIT